MSTLHEIKEIPLDPKIPVSHAYLMRVLGVYLTVGVKSMHVTYKGQEIDLIWHDKANKWEGMGSIEGEIGSKIARELNYIRDFLVDHFQFISVGA